MLCEHVFEQLRQHLGKPLTGISDAAMRSMLDYSWPGNVRELRNCLERAAILTEGGVIRPDHIGVGSRPGAAAGSAPRAAEPGSDPGSVSYTLTLPAGELSLEALSERILAVTLERCGGNKSKAAGLLKIGRKAFYRS